MKRLLIATACSFLLGACAGRAPQLIPVTQVADQQLTCEQIQAEAKINNDKITELAKEQGWKVGQNVAAGVVGLVFWPVWFGMDFQDAAGKEATALSQRNEYLVTLAGMKCGGPAETASIPQYQPR